MNKKENMTIEEVEKYVQFTEEALIDQKATNVEILPVGKLTTMADYFIICTGGSSTHIRSLSERVEHDMEETYGVRPHHIEGYREANWILMDYGFMLIHIFHRDTRQFYSLNRLWSDAGNTAAKKNEE